MSNNKLKDINNFEQLRAYLIERGNSHNFYWHYTNKDGLLGILKSGYLHLSSLGSLKMNDLHELSKGSQQERKNLYEMSLAHSNENMAMWGLYSIPFSESLCIILPKKAINKIVNNTSTNKPMVYEIIEGDNHIPNIYKPLKDCENNFITDIAYLSGKRNSIYTTIKHDRNSLKISTRPQLRGISGSEILTGLIKNDAWSYEKESRLIVRISDTNYDKIAIKIPEEVFKDFKIYFAPWVGMDFKRDIRRTLISDEYGFNQNQFQDSEFEGLVNYRGLCNYCEHKHFKRK